MYVSHFDMLIQYLYDSWYTKLTASVYLDMKDEKRYQKKKKDLSSRREGMNLVVCPYPSCCTLCERGKLKETECRIEVYEDYFLHDKTVGTYQIDEMGQQM